MLGSGEVGMENGLDSGFGIREELIVRKGRKRKQKSFCSSLRALRL